MSAIDWGNKARALLCARGIEVDGRPEPLPGLLEAAMRVCDHFGDGPEARELMHQDCLNTPAHLQADLLEHLRREYGEGGYRKVLRAYRLDTARFLTRSVRRALFPNFDP